MGSKLYNVVAVVLEVPKIATKREMTKTTCSNRGCESHSKVLHSKFCPMCGSEVKEFAFEVESYVDPIHELGLEDDFWVQEVKQDCVLITEPLPENVFLNGEIITPAQLYDIRGAFIDKYNCEINQILHFMKCDLNLTIRYLEYCY